jgi:hypothetical protein
MMNALRVARSVLWVAFVPLLATCGGGGGGGSSPPAPQTVVSGSVKAPGGQVAVFYRPDVLHRVADFLASPVHAAMLGLSSVPDGTQVELGRINSEGAFSRLATVNTSGGRYSFNLTSLGIGFSVDLVARVVGAGNAVQMQAFVIRETVDIDPLSEAAVRMALDQIAASPGTSLSNFSLQELRDLTGSLELLTTSSQAVAGPTIAASVTAIKQSAAANASFVAFLLSASGAGQTNDGPGDIGNYYPLTQGNSWRFQGTKTETGQPTSNFVNSARVAGAKSVRNVNTTVIAETNPSGLGLEVENYLVKDRLGIADYGNNDATDPLTPQLIPFRTLRFPLYPGASFESVNRKGLNFGDLDGDGRNEAADVQAQATVAALESVTVPLGTFANSARVEGRIATTVTLSSNGAKVTVASTQTEWLAPGVGPVKRQFGASGAGFTESETEELAGYFAEGKGKGRVSLTIASGIANADSNESNPGRPGLAAGGNQYLLVTCRTQGASSGLYGVFLSGTTSGAPFSIAPGDCGSLGGTSENSISQPSVAFDGTNYLVVFVKGANIHGIRVSQSGVVLDAPNGFAMSTGELFSISNTAPAVAFGGGKYLVVWRKFIPVAGAGTRNIFGATVSPNAEVSNEIPIAPEQYASDQLGFALEVGSPSIASDGTNFLISWSKVRTGPGTSIYSDLFAVYFDILGARVSSQGLVLDLQGILVFTSGPLAQSPGSENVPLAFDGANYLAVWRKTLTTGFDPPSAEIRGARISPAGNLLDGLALAGGIGINTILLGKSEPAVVFDGSNYLVAWVVGAFSNNPPVGMFGAKVSSGGELVGSLPSAIGLPLSDVVPPFTRLHFPVFGSNGESVLLAWLNNIELSGKKKSIEGSLIFP